MTDNALIAVVAIPILVAVAVVIWFAVQTPSPKRQNPALYASRLASMRPTITATIGHSFHSKIVGVACPGAEGLRRQHLVASRRPGEHLQLIREPHNPHGTSAIAVHTGGGAQIGYLPHDTAEGLAPQMDAGVNAYAVVSEVTGGQDERYYGCNIIVNVEDSQETL
jgi:hypothetical protein